MYKNPCAIISLKVECILKLDAEDGEIHGKYPTPTTLTCITCVLEYQFSADQSQLFYIPNGFCITSVSLKLWFQCKHTPARGHVAVKHVTFPWSQCPF